jgi:CheY-like chemotaxis protein
VGKGSVFSLAIPVGLDVQSPALGGQRERNEGAAPEAKAGQDFRFSGTVLLAEDSEGSQVLAKKMLKRIGFDVDIVRDGKEAIEKVRGQSYDLILMDMSMPVLDGYEAARQLRDGGVTTPIIALTAYAMEGDREKCIEAGCDDYLAKPFHPAGLATVLSKHITSENTSVL